MEQFRIISTQHISDYRAIEEMARIIMPEIYAPIIGLENCTFFVDTYQTAEAIEKQVAAGYTYYLIKEGEITVGYIATHPLGELLKLSKLYLLSTSRGKHYGEKALAFVIDKAKKGNFRAVTLEVNRQNKGSINFYLKNGFAIAEKITRTFDNGHVVEDFVMTRNTSI